MAYQGHRAGNDDRDTASHKGGQRLSRATWLGMAAVIMLAALISTAGAIIADRLPDREVAPATPAALHATMVPGQSGPISSTSAGPTTIGSAWSMAPLPEQPAFVAVRNGAAISAIDLMPLRAASSVVTSPR